MSGVDPLNVCYAGALNIGLVVGAEAPPACSTVTAMTAFRGTVPWSRKLVAAPPGKRPAGRGGLDAGITQAS